MSKKSENRRELRRKATAECFTPENLANEMLDKLEYYSPDIFSNPDKTFCDRSCGTGNLLVPALKRKITRGHNPLTALSTIYGVDIMRDNIQECRKRLLEVLFDNNVTITIEHIRTVFNNIVLTSLERFPNGALDYDFSFHKKASLKNITPWFEEIQNDPETFFEKETDPNTVTDAVEIDMFNCMDGIES